MLWVVVTTADEAFRAPLHQLRMHAKGKALRHVSGHVGFRRISIYLFALCLWSMPNANIEIHYYLYKLQHVGQ